VDVEAGLAQRDGGGEAPEAGADDGDAERRDARHDDRPNIHRSEKTIHIFTAVHNVKM
jgi:hypothetical protein